MDQMDVDQTMSTSKRPAGSPPSMPSAAKRAKHLLPDPELDKVNEKMREHSENGNWGANLVAIQNLELAFSNFLIIVLTFLHRELVSTSIKGLVSTNDISGLVEKNLQDLKISVEKCIDDGHWGALISYIHKSSLNSSAASIDWSEAKADPEAQAATMSSWQKGYLGRSADLVEGILKDCMTSKGHYARYVPHIQSSGTGKSRVHDELAKRMLYIPMCLASAGAAAYPPSDPDVRNWFEMTTDQKTVHDRCNRFLYALMTKTKDALDKIVQELKVEPVPADGSVDDVEKRIRLLASTFRSKMSGGGTYGKHGMYRVKFYRDVVKIANDEENSEVTFPSSPSGNSGSSQDSTEQDSTETNIIKSAANEVLQILDPDKRCRKKPLMILCWDESHFLTDPVEDNSWNRFSELRRALRKVKNLPIFSVFLSTAWKFHLFSPDSQYDPCHRVARLALTRLPPITEVGFDEFAEKVKPNGETTLTEVASTHHMAHLGRALFATRYDCGSEEVKANIIEFAQTKLLCREIFGRPLKTAEALACLAVRLGLEFRSTSWLESEAEREQVERHMRLCLAATAGFHDLVTISPSEPLLAEAAAKTMDETMTESCSDVQTDSSKVNFPSALLTHIDASYLDPGNRGEVVAALLLLLARDKAIKERKPTVIDADVRSDGATRIITVSELLKALLPAACSCCKKPVEDLQSSHFHSQDHAEKSLNEAFAGGRIWFNHFIKVNDFLMVNRQYLWSLISRGAAVICANNHQGIDLVVPILFGDHLKPDAVSAILIQVKNDKTFTHRVRNVLFDLMDPFKVHLFAKGEAPSFPVLRMVFALAAEQPIITHPKISTRRSSRSKSKGKYTAYDIWVAGVTDKSFGVIFGDSKTYKALLDRSCKVFNGYDLFDKRYKASEDQQKDRAKARRRMHPGAATKIEHQENYISVKEPVHVTLDDSGDEEDSEDEGKVKADS